MNVAEPTALTVPSPQPMPEPASYAEKAMASLMQLHGELMDEKERRVELYRRLMEREQALAELKMYVKMLEERVAPAPVAHTPAVVGPVAQPAPVHARPPQPARPPSPAPVPPRIGQRPEGWKVW
jgi:hypothetical protein